MSASVGTEAVKAYGRFRDQNYARAKATRAIQATWVLDSEWTAEEHLRVQRDMKAACLARHPDWFGETA